MIQSDYRTIRNTEKVYPAFSQLIVFKQPFDVAIGARQKTEKNKNKKMIRDFHKHLLEQKSLQRTKTNLKDIILCNNFELFCTFTFKDNRQDIDICKARMQYWLQSQQKLYGAFDYVIVPEFHKDGESLHFHALLGGYKGRYSPAFYKDSGKPVYSKANKRVYEMDGWRSGWGNCTIIDPQDKERAMNYIAKYITKEMPTFAGKKRYWVSQSLARPIKSTNVDVMPYVANDKVQVFENDQFTVYVVDKTKDNKSISLDGRMKGVNMEEKK